MSDCKRFMDNISDFIDNTLDDKTKQFMIEHKGICVDCKNELEFMQNIIATTNGSPKIEVPDNFSYNIRMQILNEQAKTVGKRAYWFNKRRGFAMCASALIMCSVFALVVKTDILNEFNSVPDNGTYTINNATAEPSATQAPKVVENSPINTNEVRLKTPKPRATSKVKATKEPMSVTTNKPNISNIATATPNKDNTQKQNQAIQESEYNKSELDGQLQIGEKDNSFDEKSIDASNIKTFGNTITKNVIKIKITDSTISKQDIINQLKNNVEIIIKDNKNFIKNNDINKAMDIINGIKGITISTEEEDITKQINNLNEKIKQDSNNSDAIAELDDLNMFKDFYLIEFSN